MKFQTFLLLIFLSFNSFAFTGTEKQVQVVVPFAAGGTVDGFFREIQIYAATRGIDMRPVYRPGAQGAIGLRELFSLPSDGYAISVALIDSVAAYKIATNRDVDTNSIFFLHQSIFGIVMKNTNTSSITEVTSRLKTSNTGATFGYSTPIQSVVLTNMFTQMGVTNNYVLVNYGKSGLTIISDIGSNALDIGIGSLSTYEPHIISGRLKLIAVDSRYPVETYPNVPTLHSLYPNILAVHRGSCVVINSTNEEATAFWRQFMTDYTNTARFKERAKTEFYEIKKLTPKDISKTVSENVTLLRAIQAKE